MHHQKTLCNNLRANLSLLLKAIWVFYSTSKAIQSTGTKVVRDRKVYDIICENICLFMKSVETYGTIITTILGVIRGMLWLAGTELDS